MKRDKIKTSQTVMHSSWAACAAVCSVFLLPLEESRGACLMWWFAAIFNRDGVYIGLENWEHSLLPLYVEKMKNLYGII